MKETPFETDIEREFFRCAYRATLKLAMTMHDEFTELSGSSQSRLMEIARKRLGLDNNLAKQLLRNNSEAMVIGIEIREDLLDDAE